MKKVFLSAAPAMAVAGSWAFYPKAAELAGCMMIISNPSRSGFGNGITITTVAPDGTQREQSTKIKRSLLTSLSTDAIEAHKLELAVLNSYTRDGWHLLSVTPATVLDKGTTSEYQTVYILERR